MVSCSVDPRIPEKYRENLNVGCGSGQIEGYGINISIESIDFLNKLSENPLSDFGKEMYFGLDGIDDVYKFARAEDFDAFLWFVMHKGKFPNASIISNMADFSDNIHGVGHYNVTPNNATLLDTITLSSASNSPCNIMLGNTFTYSGSPRVVSMCIDRKYDSENKIVSNILVPTSSNICSVNWYVRRADYLKKNLGFGKKRFESRDFSKEIALCNLQYFDTASSNIYPSNGLVNNIVRLTIKPKPFIHIPKVDEGEKPWGFVPLLFDSQGNYDINGKYTVVFDQEELPEASYTKFKNYATYTTGTTTGTTDIKINIRSGNVSITDKNELKKHLVECYKGLTVYEFNYDFVMGMKLFDAKVMATTLLDTLVNTRLGLNASLGKKHQDATDKIKEIIKNIINSDDSSVEDCYFSFDNEKYNQLLRSSEEKRAKDYAFGSNASSDGLDKVYEILDEYDSASSLEERIDVINRAITQASIAVANGAEEEDKYSIEFGFVFDLIENLVFAIINAILSPKVLLLLEVNRQIMGGNWKAFTIEDLLKAMQGIIISIIKEVRDLVIQELLKLVLKYLQPLKEMIESILLREQIEEYTSAINSIIKNCPMVWFNFGYQPKEVKLDTVDYADIDINEIINAEKPNENC